MKAMFKRIAVVSISLFMSFLIYDNVLAAPTSFTGIEDYEWFTRDSVQNLDFLDLNIDNNAFTNKQWYFFESGIEYGGRQWRLATVVEVCNIWRLAQPLAPSGPNMVYGSSQDPYIAELGTLFGWTQPGNYDLLSGWTSTLTGSGDLSYWVPILWDEKRPVPPYGGDSYSTLGKTIPTNQLAQRGAWLVSEVPIPPTLLLLGSGLAGLAVYRRKVKGTKR